MIMDKGSYAFAIRDELELRALKSRIKQLEKFIKDKGHRMPRRTKVQDLYLGGYNLDSEE